MTLWRAARSEADRRESLASFRTGASEAGWTIPHAVGSAPFVVPPLFLLEPHEIVLLVDPTAAGRAAVLGA